MHIILPAKQRGQQNRAVDNPTTTTVSGPPSHPEEFPQRVRIQPYAQFGVVREYDVHARPLHDLPDTRWSESRPRNTYMSPDARFGSSTTIESSPLLESADHVMGHLVTPFDDDPRIARANWNLPPDARRSQYPGRRCTPSLSRCHYNPSPGRRTRSRSTCRGDRRRGAARAVNPEDGADEIREFAEARAVPTNPVACGARSEALRMSLDECRRTLRG